MTRTVKVAIVGSGLAGLTAAYLFNGHHHTGDVHFDVHLFEKEKNLGMDSSSISLPLPGKSKDWRIDVPMRSFQGGYYPNLIALYNRIGVLFRRQDFTYSFSTLTESRGIVADLIYNGRSGLGGVGMPSKRHSLREEAKDMGYAIRAAVWLWTIVAFVLATAGLLFCYVRLLSFSVPYFRPRSVQKITFAQWAEDNTPSGTVAHFLWLDTAWEDFVHKILIPLFSAVCTASEDDIRSHPVEEFLDYIWLTLGTSHYVASFGVRQVVSKLVAGVGRVHLGCTISEITPNPDHPTLFDIRCLGSPQTVHEGFHHIIFATQACSAVPLLSTLTGDVNELIRCLKTFHYAPTLVINHTDDNLLPNNIHDRRDLNLISAKSSFTSSPSETCLPSTYTMATQIVPRPAGFPAHMPDVFQTTNPIIPPREARILSTARLERAVLTIESKEALEQLYTSDESSWWRRPQDKLGRLQGKDGIWICGSYAYKGIPLLEGCVVSAKLVAEGIMRKEGVRLKNPW